MWTWRMTSVTRLVHARYKSQNHEYPTPSGAFARYSSHNKLSVTPGRRRSRCSEAQSGKGRELAGRVGGGGNSNASSLMSSSSSGGRGHVSPARRAAARYLLTAPYDIPKLRAIACCDRPLEK